jgi:hypothetical protein
VQLTLGGNAAPSKIDPELDPTVELPFAPEPGVGLALGEQLFATGLRREGRSTLAMLARFGPEPESPDLVEIARLQGDAAPPRLAADGGQLIVGVQETTPTGYALRVARIEPEQLRASLVWQAAPPQSKDESNVFDLGASEGRVVVVWDEWLTEARHGRIASFVFDADPASQAQALSAPAVDAETPRISVRPGGYWVAWLVNLDASAGRIYDPGSGGEDPTASVQPGSFARRGIELLMLDARGHRSGEPLRVTGADDHVVGYDLATGPEGSAWLVWRHDVPSPGAIGGRITMAEVREDGGMETSLLADSSIGAGEPSWLPARAEPGPWLTFPDDADQTLLFRVQRPLAITESLALIGDTKRAAALGAAGDRILFAAARGPDIEFFPARCDAPRARSSVSGAAPSALVPRPDAAPAAPQ